MGQLFPEPINPIEPGDGDADLPCADGRPAVRLNIHPCRRRGVGERALRQARRGADHRVFTSLGLVNDQKATR
jgi:hypothetical protein